MLTTKNTSALLSTDCSPSYNWTFGLIFPCHSPGYWELPGLADDKRLVESEEVADVVPWSHAHSPHWQCIRQHLPAPQAEPPTPREQRWEPSGPSDPRTLLHFRSVLRQRVSPRQYNIKFIQTVRYQLYPDSTKSNVSRLYNIKCIQTVQYQVYKDSTISNVSRQKMYQYGTILNFKCIQTKLPT